HPSRKRAKSRNKDDELMAEQKLLLQAIRREPVKRRPLWIMRQAGRYLPEYREIRRRVDFLTLCKTPDLAAEVTVQPVDLVGVDAAIIFSDILVVPQAMGMALSVEEGTGPRFHLPLRAPADFDRLRDPDPQQDLGYVLEALRLARRSLEGRVPLIGFAGAPWTLMSYMVEGSGSKSFARAKRLLVEEPGLAHQLLARLARAVGDFLVAQVRAGAQAVQLFDSWAAALGPRDFREFALPYLAEAVGIARGAGAPVIAFAPGAGWALEEIAAATRADVIGVDWQTEAGEARRRLAGAGVALQGNLDPCWLYARPEIVRERTHAMLAAFGARGHIANLGHGILPDVPVAHARAFIEAVQEWRP
ncbi:MAG TPA: uroporphyrinogen decarboxylase, partial [Gemmatimonadales bacterium]